MTSSSKRPHSSKSNLAESSSKSNPLNLTRLLANDAQRKVFEENFHGRAIFTPKYANDIYPELVRVFYCNMNFRKNLMASHVKGNDIFLDIKTFSSICYDIPMTGDITGFSLVCDWDDYDRNKLYLFICRIPKEETKRRKQQSLDDNATNVACSRLPKFVALRHLHYQILEYFGVSLDGESKVALNLREIKVDVEVVHKMGFVIDPVTRRTYKHRTDRQSAPTDEPEPTAEPNESESHAPSSSSAAMPTN
ncbi:hypothetical protein Lal_00011400 [Lupinus albus]|nr:hypothetical protein Lal_00011400 [Lupinus albus]